MASVNQRSANASKHPEMKHPEMKHPEMKNPEMKNPEMKNPETSQETDIFTDPALKAPLTVGGDLQRVAFEDPFARLIINHWKQIVLVIAAVAAGLYAKQVFDQTQIASQRRAADLFAAVRSSYEQIINLKSQRTKAADELAAASVAALVTNPASKDAKKNADPAEISQRIAGLETRITEREALLTQSITSLGDARQPYQALAGLYGELLSRAGKPVDSSVVPLNVGELANSWAQQNGELRLIAELSALAKARGLLDQDSTLDQGVSILKALSSSGHYVATSAGLTLARIASTDSERAAALAILESVRKANPEQGALIEPELARLR